MNMEITPIPIRLTRRERQILALVAEGQTSNDIAGQLYLSVRTVENHRVNLLRKLNARNTPVMLNRAREANLLEEKRG
jgi:DNA-binding NarL/FixJ family response regulator